MAKLIQFSLSQPINSINLYFPKGKYKLKMDLPTTPQQVEISIIGDGRKTVFVPSDNADYVIKVGSDDVSNSTFPTLSRFYTLKDFMIDATNIKVDGIVIGYTQYVYLHSLYLEGMRGRAIYFKAAMDVNIDDCDFGNCGDIDNGIYAFDMTNIASENFGVPTNAVKITNSHFELVPLIIYTHGSVTQIEITNTKFEKGATNTTSNRPFKLREISGFTCHGCIITNNEKDKSGIIVDGGESFMNILGDNISFVGCNFFVSPNTTSRWYSGSGTSFIGCNFLGTEGSMSDKGPFVFQGNNMINGCVINTVNGNHVFYYFSGNNYVNNTYIYGYNSSNSDSYALIANTNGYGELIINTDCTNDQYPFVGGDMANDDGYYYNAFKVDVGLNHTTATSSRVILNSNTVYLNGTDVTQCAFGNDGEIYTFYALKDTIIKNGYNMFTNSVSDITVHKGQSIQFLCNKGYMREIYR